VGESFAHYPGVRDINVGDQAAVERDSQ